MVRVRKSAGIISRIILHPARNGKTISTVYSTPARSYSLRIRKSSPRILFAHRPHIRLTSQNYATAGEFQTDKSRPKTPENIRKHRSKNAEMKTRLRETRSRARPSPYRAEYRIHSGRAYESGGRERTRARGPRRVQTRNVPRKHARNESGPPR